MFCGDSHLEFTANSEFCISQNVHVEVWTTDIGIHKRGIREGKSCIVTQIQPLHICIQH